MLVQRERRPDPRQTSTKLTAAPRASRVVQATDRRVVLAGITDLAPSNPMEWGVGDSAGRIQRSSTSVAQPGPESVPRIERRTGNEAIQRAPGEGPASRIQRRTGITLIQREPGDGDDANDTGRRGVGTHDWSSYLSITLWNWTVGWSTGVPITALVPKIPPPTRVAEKTSDTGADKPSNTSAKPEPKDLKSKGPQSKSPQSKGVQSNEVKSQLVAPDKPGEKLSQQPKLVTRPQVSAGKKRNKKQSQTPPVTQVGSTVEVPKTTPTIEPESIDAGTHVDVPIVTPQPEVDSKPVVELPEKKKQTAGDKKRAAAARAEEKAQEDRKYCEEKVASLDGKVEALKLSATMYGFGVAAVNKLVHELGSKVRKKLSPADLRIRLDAIDVAITEAYATHREHNDAQKVLYEKRQQQVNEQVGRVSPAAKLREIDTTTMDTSLAAMTEAATADVPNWVEVCRHMAKAAKAADAAQLLLDSADEYDTLKDSALLQAETAKEDARLLQLQPTPPSESAKSYFKTLKLSVSWLDDALKSHVGHTAPVPEWSKLLDAIKAIASAAERVQREIAVAPLRPQGLVGAYGTDVIEVQDRAAIDGDGEDDEQDALDIGLAAFHGTDTSWKTEIESQGGVWDAHHGNYKRSPLPLDDKYREYYLRKPASATTQWGGRRLVVNEDETRIYYSWTHYGEHGSPAFVLLS